MTVRDYHFRMTVRTTSPPPDHAAALLRQIRREMNLSFGDNAVITLDEEIPWSDIQETS